MPWFGNRTLINRILNPSPIHQSNSQIPKVLSMLSPKSKILDLGAGGRKITPDTIAVDFIQLGAVDIIADIHDLSIKDNYIDCVFCTGTFEHVEFPEKIIKEIVRILKKKGLCYIDVPFMQCYHPDPVDYWRFTINGLELICMLNGLTKVDSGVNIGTASSATWILMSFFQSFFSDGFISKVCCKLFDIFICPFKYLDKYTTKGDNSIIAPSAVYFLGTKE